MAYRLTTRVSADYRHDEVDVVYGVDTGKAYIPDILGAETSYRHQVSVGLIARWLIDMMRPFVDVPLDHRRPW